MTPTFLGGAFFLSHEGIIEQLCQACGNQNTPGYRLCRVCCETFPSGSKHQRSFYDPAEIACIHCGTLLDEQGEPLK